MRLIKLAVASMVVLFVVSTAITSLFPSIVVVSRAVNILALRDSIFPRISTVAQWKNWIDGMNDTTVQIISPTKATMNGTQVTITSVTDSSVSSKWQTRNGEEQVSTIRLIPDAQGKLTVVQWQFVEKMKWYPWEKLGSMMNDKIMGTMMEKTSITSNDLLSMVTDQATAPD